MLKSLVSTESMPRKDWLEWRKKGIGGSDAPVICGLNKYKSPVELWMEKTGQIIPLEASEPAYWGNALEPLIRDEFSKRTGLEVHPHEHILQSTEHPFMLANIDGIILDPIHDMCIYEGKTCSAHLAYKWENDLPEEYFIQVQHYMSVTGLEGAYISVLIGGNQFKWKFIKRDEEVISMLIKLEEIFWKHVENLTPPPLDGSEASTALLNRLYPQGTPKNEVILPEEAIKLITAYEEYHNQEKLASLQKEKASNLIKSMLGDNVKGIAGERIVTWNNVTREKLDIEKLKSEMPEVYSKYVTSSTYRRFYIK